MSWAEVVKINSDLSKPLNELIEERASAIDNGNSAIRNALGTDTNFMLSEITGSVALKNRTLVEKINLLLLNTGSMELVSSNNTIYSSTAEVTGGISAYATVCTYTPPYSGTIKISIDTRISSTTGGGVQLYYQYDGKSRTLLLTSTPTTTYSTYSATLLVEKGKTVTFSIYNPYYTYYCRNFYVKADRQFVF